MRDFQVTVMGREGWKRPLRQFVVNARSFGAAERQGYRIASETTGADHIDVEEI